MLSRIYCLPRRLYASPFTLSSPKTLASASYSSSYIVAHFSSSTAGDSKNSNQSSTSEPNKNHPPKLGFLHRLDQRLTEKKLKRDRVIEDAPLGSKDAQFRDATTIRGKIKRKVDQINDYKTILNQRENLQKEAFQHGYFDDLIELKNKEGKLWEAPSELIPMEMSPKIFKIDCLSLSNKPVNLYEKCKGKVSIVTFEFAASGEQHVKTFIDKMSADLVANSSKLQHIRVNVEEIWTKTGVAKMMRYFIRRKVPEQHHDNYLSYFSSIEQMRRAVGISNRLIGWVLLVDSKGLIRWMANGPATEKEIETLRRFIK